MRRLRLVACIVSLLPAGAWAVLTPPEVTGADSTPVTNVSLTHDDAGKPVTLSADQMGADEENHIVVALGNVEVMQGDAILTADQITYYQTTNMVVATGNVSMLQPTGDVYFAEKAQLKDDMKQAVIAGFKARFQDNSVLVARHATKVNSATTKLKEGSYTPCHVCKDLAPFWQVNADDATVDDLDERVIYHNASMDIFGLPIFYTPYLSHPTPSASAKSGFLTPTYSTTDYFGVLAKVPYYWRINEDKDVVITPWFTSTQGALLTFDYRQLTDNGNYHLRGSGTYPSALDSNGNTKDGNEFRGHIFAQGDEKIAEDTHLGFDIQRASDDTYLRRYGFGSQQSLFSRAYYEKAQGRNFGLLEGLSIQGLRSTDNPKTTPLVLPILQGYYETPADRNGIKYHVAADAQMLSRDVGVDQKRLSLTPGASLPFVTRDGQIFTATVNLRGDIYNTDPGGTTPATREDTTTTRVLPQAALEWRLPLINHIAGGAWIVEPIVLGVFQPNGGNPGKISNEDTRLIELTDTNLFSLNRMPGLDLVDSGSRLAYGVRTHYYDTTGIAYDAMLGQNYAFNGDSPFPNSTKKGQQFSDYIGRVGATYDPLSLTYRFAADQKTLGFNRHEVQLGFAEPWLSMGAGYRAIQNNSYIKDSKEATLQATLPFTDQWSIYGNGMRDVDRDAWVATGAGLIYHNECFNLVFDTLRSYSRDRDIEPATTFTFRVGFKNLGEFGGK